MYTYEISIQILLTWKLVKFANYKESIVALYSYYKLYFKFPWLRMCSVFEKFVYNLKYKIDGSKAVVIFSSQLIFTLFRYA